MHVTDASDVVLDIDGYFAPLGTGGLSLYTVTPCRVIDTRSGAGAFSGVLKVNVGGSTCAPPSTAQAYVFNATVVPDGGLNYLTLWPDGQAETFPGGPVDRPIELRQGEGTLKMKADHP